MPGFDAPPVPAEFCSVCADAADAINTIAARLATIVLMPMLLADRSAQSHNARNKAMFRRYSFAVEYRGGNLPGENIAVRTAQTYIAAGDRYVVDIDLEKFFDRVNHDILMGLVAKRVDDRRILRLIRGFLTAGVLADGLVGPTDEGTVGRSRRCCRT